MPTPAEQAGQAGQGGVATSLGDRIRQAARLPVLAPHRPALGGLARVLDEQEGLRPTEDPQALTAPADAWAQLDLVRTYARPETFAPPPEPPLARWAGRLELLPPVLVFVPLCVTWLGLSAATDAYQELRSTPEGRELADKQSFLELWQEGFQGRLGGLAFGSMVWWTLGTLLLLALLILFTGLIRRRTERAGDRAVQEAAAVLTPLLTEAQLRINRLRWESPARLAGELSRGAETLGGLLASAKAGQDSLRSALDRTGSTLQTVRDLVTEVGKVAPALGRGTEDLRSAAEALNASQRTAAAAVATVNQDMRSHLESVASATRLSLTRAQEQNTKVSEAAAQRLEQAGQLLAGLIRENGDVSAAALEEIGSGMHAAADSLTASGRDLTTAGAELAQWVRRTTDEGAAEMARVFRLAIAAAAVELANAVEAVGRAQAERTERISQVVDRFDTLLLAEADRRRTAMQDMTAEIVRLRETVAALDRSAPSRDPSPAPDSPRTDRPPRAATDRPGERP